MEAAMQNCTGTFLKIITDPLVCRHPFDAFQSEGTNRAARGNRTHNLLITSQLLCQLSYSGMNMRTGQGSNLRHPD